MIETLLHIANLHHHNVILSKNQEILAACSPCLYSPLALVNCIWKSAHLTFVFSILFY